MVLTLAVSLPFGGKDDQQQVGNGAERMSTTHLVPACRRRASSYWSGTKPGDRFYGKTNAINIDKQLPELKRSLREFTPEGFFLLKLIYCLYVSMQTWAVDKNNAYQRQK